MTHAAPLPLLREYPTGDLSERNSAAATPQPQPAGILGYRATGGRFLEAEWRDALRPEHARVVARHEQHESEQQARNGASSNGAAVAPPPVVAPPPAPATAPLVEPRTKEELDAEARVRVKLGRFLLYAC